MNYDGVSKNVTAVGFHEDGKWMFTGGEDCSARIWDLRFACPCLTFKGYIWICTCEDMFLCRHHLFSNQVNTRFSSMTVKSLNNIFLYVLTFLVYYSRTKMDANV